MNGMLDRALAALHGIQFAVDVQAQRLEAARGRMLARLATTTDDARDQLRQLQRALQRLFAARVDDGLGDAPAHALLAEPPQHVGDPLGIRMRQKLCRALALARIHAHIQRAVDHEAETACRLVQLR